MEDNSEVVPSQGFRPGASGSLETSERDLLRAQEIARQLIAIDSRDPRLRVEAARRLGSLRAAPDALLRALDDPNSQVRSVAADALGNGVNEEFLADVVEGLLAAIDDANDRVCSAAITSLGRLKVVSCRDEIWDCLDDANPFVAGAAVTALARLGCTDLTGRLAAFLDSEHEYVKQRAAQAAALLGYSQAGPALLRNLKAGLQAPTHRRNEKMLAQHIQALAVLDIQEAVPLLVEIAQKEVGLRGRATEALLALRAEGTIEILARMLADPSTRLRKNLIHMAVEAGYQQALPLIRPLLQDPGGDVRQAALNAVFRLRDRAAGDAVRQMAFYDPNPFLRAQAVPCLVDLRGAESLPDLLALSADLNPGVRRAVAAGLGAQQNLTPDVAAALVRLSSDPDLETSSAARAALDRHAGQLSELPPVSPEPDQPLLPPDLCLETPALLDILRRWQAGLPGCVTAGNLKEVGQVDAALTLLIELLRPAARDSVNEYKTPDA